MSKELRLFYGSIPPGWYGIKTNTSFEDREAAAKYAINFKEKNGVVTALLNIPGCGDFVNSWAVIGESVIDHY